MNVLSKHAGSLSKHLQSGFAKCCIQTSPYHSNRGALGPSPA